MPDPTAANVAIDKSVWGFVSAGVTAIAFKVYKHWEEQKTKAEDEPTVIRRELREEVKELRVQVRHLQESLNEAYERIQEKTEEYLEKAKEASQLTLALEKISTQYAEVSVKCSALEQRVEVMVRMLDKSGAA